MPNHYAKPFKFISYYLSHYKFLLVIGILFVVCTVFFQLLSPWILRFAVDYIQNVDQPQANFILTHITDILGPEKSANPVNIILAISTIIVGVTIIGGTFRFLMRFTLIGVSRKIEVEIRNDYFAHLLKLSPSFYDKNQTGDLMSRAINDLEAVRSIIGPGIMHLISTLLVAIFAVVLMFKISAHLTLWSIIPLPIVVIVVNRLLSHIHKLFTKIQAQFSVVTSKVEENISGIRIVKSYVQENNQIDTFKNMNKELVNRNLALAKIRALLRTNIEFILAIGIIIVLWVGGSLVIHQKLTIGGLVAFIAYFAMLAWPMIALGWVLNLWQQGLASLKRMLVIWNEQPDIQDSSLTKQTIEQVDGEIEFKNLTFKFNENGPDVLKNINLKIKSGETLAIVGHTGSGKSTMAHLVAQLYKPPIGTLFIDGTDIREFPLQLLRQNIGFVQQESFLFSDTLEANIAFGVEEFSDESLTEAAQISQLNLDMDQFPEKFKTIVGERGITLSGGQKQRTSISRAIIRKPKILILDDALSAVDTYTEEEILRELRKLMKNRTSIIVSHRVSTIRDADKIIVLDDGKITEQGTYDELLAQKGTFFRMHEQQQLESSLADI